jgi:hypothetical protein
MKVYINSYLFDFSDSGGDYSIENVPAGTYEVWTTETQAYRAASKEAMVTSGETTIKNFTILYFTDPVDTTPPEFNI